MVGSRLSVPEPFTGTDKQLQLLFRSSGRGVPELEPCLCASIGFFIQHSCCKFLQFLLGQIMYGIFPAFSVRLALFRAVLIDRLNKFFQMGNVIDRIDICISRAGIRAFFQKLHIGLRDCAVFGVLRRRAAAGIAASIAAGRAGIAAAGAAGAARTAAKNRIIHELGCVQRGAGCQGRRQHRASQGEGKKLFQFHGSSSFFWGYLYHHYTPLPPS